MTDQIKVDELKLEVPTLTIGDTAAAEAPAPAEEAPAPVKEIPIEDRIELTPEEQKVVDEFIAKIDLTNTNHILQYGSDAQQKMAAFSDTALESVRTKDLGKVGDSLADLVSELKGFSALEEKKGFLGLFKKVADPLTQLKTKYAKAENNVEKVVEVLEGHLRRLCSLGKLDKRTNADIGYGAAKVSKLFRRSFYVRIKRTIIYRKFNNRFCHSL